MSPHRTVASVMATAVLLAPACFGGGQNKSVNPDAGVNSPFDASLPTYDAPTSSSDTGGSRHDGSPSTDAPSIDAPAGGADAEGGSTTAATGVVQTIAGGPFQPFVSGDGRYVAFSSADATLVAGDTNGATDTFVWDTCVGSTAPAGCAPSTVRVSVANDGSQLSQGVNGDGSSISADGRFVVFDSPSNSAQIYLRDTCAGHPTGCTPSTILVSGDISGNVGNGASERPAVSANGRVVAFDSTSTNLGADSAAGFNVFVRDTCFGAATGCTPSTTSVPVAQGTPEPFLALSGDGRTLAYEGTSIAGDGGIRSGQVNMVDTCIGASAGCSPSTTLVSVAADGSAANALVQTPGVSDDGRRVAFQTGATNLVTPSSSGQAQNVFVRDTCLGSTASVGCVPTTSVLFNNTSGCGVCAPINYENTQYVSATGRFVALSTMPNVAAHSVSVFDTCFGAPAGCTPSNAQVSLDSAGQVIPVTYYGLSRDGHYLAFSNAQKSYIARTGF